MKYKRYDLTEKQSNVYDYICDYLKSHGFPPTVREIASMAGLSSTSSAHSVKPQIISGDFRRLFKAETPVTVCG